MTVQSVSGMGDPGRSSPRKKIVSDFFRLVAEGKPKEGLKYFAQDCVQHNPYVRGGMDALFDSMLAAMKDGLSKYSEPDFRVRYVVEDGDFVAVYTQLLYNRSKPETG